MRKIFGISTMLFATMLLVGCEHSKGPLGPATATTTTTATSGHPVFKFSAPVGPLFGASSPISMTITGTTTNDLINGFAAMFDPSNSLTSTDRWPSGSIIHLSSWNGGLNGKIGWTGNNNEPFNPPAVDHYQFDVVPTDGKSLDLSMEMIPGNQPVGGPFHLIKLLLDSSIEVVTPKAGLQYTFAPDPSTGVIHMKGPFPF